MRAWLLPAFNGIPSMTLGTAPDPVPEKGQVILDVHYASLNPADAYLAIGQYPGKPVFPHILGRDAVGIVSALGPAVEGIQVGDKRIILRSYVGVTKPGTLAQRVAVDAAYTATVPDGWSDTQAAAAPLVYLTAWQALTQWGELPPGAIVLVSGASGGVGVATVQLGKALGYRVAALSRSPEKSQTLRDLGAEWTLSPENPNWPGDFKKLLDAASDQHGAPPSQAPRVDLAVDNIGGETFSRMLDVMGNNGRISCVGRLAGPVPSFNTASLFFRRIKIGGVAVGSYRNSEAVAAWHSVLVTLAKTGAKPLIDHVFSFEEVPAAFARLAEGPMGKVLVQVAG